MTVTNPTYRNTGEVDEWLGWCADYGSDFDVDELERRLMRYIRSVDPRVDYQNFIVWLVREGSVYSGPALSRMLTTYTQEALAQFVPGGNRPHHVEPPLPTPPSRPQSRQPMQNLAPARHGWIYNVLCLLSIGVIVVSIWASFIMLRGGSPWNEVNIFLAGGLHGQEYRLEWHNGSILFLSHDTCVPVFTAYDGTTLKVPPSEWNAADADALLKSEFAGCIDVRGSVVGTNGYWSGTSWFIYRQPKVEHPDGNRPDDWSSFWMDGRLVNFTEAMQIKLAAPDLRATGGAKPAAVTTATSTSNAPLPTQMPFSPGGGGGQQQPVSVVSDNPESTPAPSGAGENVQTVCLDLIQKYRDIALDQVPDGERRNVNICRQNYPDRQPTPTIVGVGQEQSGAPTSGANSARTAEDDPGSNEPVPIPGPYTVNPPSPAEMAQDKAEREQERNVLNSVDNGPGTNGP